MCPTKARISIRFSSDIWKAWTRSDYLLLLYNKIVVVIILHFSSLKK